MTTGKELNNFKIFYTFKPQTRFYLTRSSPKSSTCLFGKISRTPGTSLLNIALVCLMHFLPVLDDWTCPLQFTFHHIVCTPGHSLIFALVPCFGQGIKHCFGVVLSCDSMICLHQGKSWTDFDNRTKTLKLKEKQKRFIVKRPVVLLSYHSKIRMWRSKVVADDAHHFFGLRHPALRCVMQKMFH